MLGRDVDSFWNYGKGLIYDEKMEIKLFLLLRLYSIIYFLVMYYLMSMIILMIYTIFDNLKKFCRFY